MTRRALPAVADPGDYRLSHIHGQRHAVRLSAFAADENPAGPPVDVVEPYRDRFLPTQTEPGHHQQHRMIAPFTRAVAARRFDQGPNRVRLQMTRETIGPAPCRSGNGVGQVARKSAAPEKEPQDVAQIG